MLWDGHSFDKDVKTSVIDRSYTDNHELVMLWDGHSFDKDVKTSVIDRSYTDYSEKYALAEAEKLNYEL